jgi:hypothetical protein
MGWDVGKGFFENVFFGRRKDTSRAEKRDTLGARFSF